MCVSRSFAGSGTNAFSSHSASASSQSVPSRSRSLSFSLIARPPRARERDAARGTSATSAKRMSSSARGSDFATAGRRSSGSPSASASTIPTSPDASAATRACDASARLAHARASAFDATTALHRSGRSFFVLREIALASMPLDVREHRVGRRVDLHLAEVACRHDDRCDGRVVPVPRDRGAPNHRKELRARRVRAWPERVVALTPRTDDEGRGHSPGHPLDIERILPPTYRSNSVIPNAPAHAAISFRRAMPLRGSTLSLRVTPHPDSDGPSASAIVGPSRVQKCEEGSDRSRLSRRRVDNVGGSSALRNRERAVAE